MRSTLALLFVLIVSAESMGAITAVSLTPAPTTTLSDGNTYYLAGIQYTFRIQATDALATGKAYWDYVEFTLPGGIQCRVSVDTDLPVISAGVVVDNVSDNTPPGPYTNLDYSITIRVLWNAAATAVGSNNAVANVREDGGSTGTDTDTFVFGIVTSVRVLAFTQSGVAADGRVNPWHDAFSVTGTLVYNIASPTVADGVDTRDAGEVTTTELMRTAVATGFTDNSPDDLAYNIPAQYFTGFALGNYTWSVSATMSTAPGTEVSANTLAINNDRVEITAIQIINGGGVDTPPSYYRSTLIPGTQVQVTARMQNGLGAMVGNTTITVRNIFDGAPGDFTVQILNGQFIGVGNVPNPTTAVPVNSTRPDNYRVEAITNGAYGGDTPPNGQNETSTPGSIQQPANPTIYWDNSDEPGINGANVSPGAGTGWG